MTPDLPHLAPQLAVGLIDGPHRRTRTMTDQPIEPTVDSSSSGTAATAETGRPPESVEPEPRSTFEERMNRFGKQAEAAGERWSRGPGVVRAADTASRLWGAVVLAIGLWFFADVTLGYDMPSIAWRDLWPVVLIALGLIVVIRGMTRRRA
jgi:Domain of unknown function (DUF5668)